LIGQFRGVQLLDHCADVFGGHDDAQGLNGLEGFGQLVKANCCGGTPDLLEGTPDLSPSCLQLYK
jgi:hypothetical protein